MPSLRRAPPISGRPDQTGSTGRDSRRVSRRISRLTRKGVWHRIAAAVPTVPASDG